MASIIVTIAGSVASISSTHAAHRNLYSSRSSRGGGRRRLAVVRAEAGAEPINPAIRKSEDKVVDSVLLSDLAKPLTAYCRCWRSATFPLCDGSHVKHNKATGDNVGPLLLKKQ
ncbi:CDGSH iron-sulfur domain-containing protein NEET [Momordica charantia]|uniref:CDGSH iron-sulfur domain-containing protein NEET n=1 Tax=Momordica charantia TaxID=3673 RepID=A0A6J1E4B9_MOMCH|nr:CDGSH iron-sulfur domain-containing protein NEET [Momordica charantia]